MELALTINPGGREPKKEWGQTNQQTSGTKRVNLINRHPPDKVPKANSMENALHPPSRHSYRVGILDKEEPTATQQTRKEGGRSTPREEGESHHRANEK